MVGRARERVRVVRAADLSPADLECWWSLYGRAIEPHPNTTPAWMLGSAPTLEQRRELLLCVLESDGAWQALLLTAVGTAQFARRERTALSNGSGVLGDATIHRQPLIAGDDPARSMTTLLRGLGRLTRAPMIEMTMLPLDGPSGAAVTAAARAARRPFLVEPGSPRVFTAKGDVAWEAPPSTMADYVRAVPRLGASTGKSLRRHANGLDRWGSGPVTVTDDTDRAGALDEFVELQNAGWKGDRSRGGMSPRVRGVETGWRESVDAFREQGTLRLLGMRVDGRLLYMSLGVQAGATVYGFADAYDEALASHRPGTIGRIVTAVEWLRRPDVDRYDPCMEPFNADSTRIYPSSRPFGTVTCVLRPGLTSMLMAAKVLKRQMQR